MITPINRITAFACILLAGTAHAQWETLSCENEPVARHEAGFIAFEGKAYLLGGRRISPVSIFNPSTRTWETGSEPPLEIHHFQPVAYEDAILVVGAMTGPFPNETPVDRILKYLPGEDRWEWGMEIPEERRRGGAGVAIHDDTLYLCAGITRGHMGGFVPWLDALDLKTGQWQQLPDAPHARDHFQSAIVNEKIYLAGGRRTSHETKDLFNLTVPQVDVFDISTQRWDTLSQPLPTPRAGNTTHPFEQRIVVAGGESVAQKEAHAEVEACDLQSENWIQLPSLNRGRHGTGFAVIDRVVYTSSGSGNRGGRPELSDIEATSTRELLDEADLDRR